MPKQTGDGIQIMQMYDVRNAIYTSAATVSTGTATALRAGDTDYYMDLVKITATTTSVVAAGTAGFNVALINDGGTLLNLSFGHSDYVDIDFPAPLQQTTKNTPWNIDMDDVTTTSVTVLGTFVKRNQNS